MNIDALIRNATGKKSPDKKKSTKKKGRNTGTVGKKVSFRTADGVLVQFTPKKRAPGDKKGKRKASAYNRFVGRRIRQLVKKGYTNPKAMKQAAKEWSAGKR